MTEVPIKNEKSFDKTFIDSLELSVLKLSEIIDRKISEVTAYASEVNDSVSSLAYSTLENLKSKQKELEVMIERIKEIGVRH